MDMAISSGSDGGAAARPQRQAAIETPGVAEVLKVALPAPDSFLKLG